MALGDMMNDVLKGVLLGGIPLGTAINDDRRANEEAEQLKRMNEQNMRIAEAQEARAVKDFDFNYALATRKEDERQDAQRFQVLQGVLDANGGDMNAMLSSPQAGIVAAELMASDPAMAERIGSNGAKPKSFVRSADGDGYVLMVEKDGKIAPLTADRTAGTAAVKFSQQELSGILAGRAAALGVGDGFSVALNDQALQQAASSAPAPDRIAYAANLGAVQAPKVSAPSSNVSKPIADNSPRAQQPKPAQKTPEFSSVTYAEPDAGVDPALNQPSAPLPEGPRTGAAVPFAQGLDAAKRNLAALQSRAALATEAERSNMPQNVESLPPTIEADGKTYGLDENGGYTVELVRDTPEQATSKLGNIRRQFSQEVRAEQRGGTQPEESTWQTKLFGKPAPDSEGVTARDLGEGARGLVDRVANATRKVVDDPLRVNPLYSLGKDVADAVGGTAVGGAVKKAVSKTAAEFKEGFTHTTASVKKDTGVDVADVATDEDLKSPTVTATPPSHGGEPTNQVERQLASGRVSKSVAADPAKRTRVEQEIEAQLKSSTPQQVVAGNAAALTSFSPRGGNITARQRYAAMRLFQAKAISGDMLGNFLQSGRYSFDDVHAAASMVQAQASMMRARQSAQHDDAMLRLRYAELLDAGDRAKADLLVKQTDAAKKEIQDVITTYSGSAAGVMAGSGAARYYGAVDAKGNVKPEEAQKVWASQLKMALLDPSIRASLNGDENGPRPIPYYAITPEVVERAQNMLTGFNQDPSNRELFKRGGLFDLYGTEAGAVPSAGEFVRWATSKNGRKWLDMQRARNAGSAQGEDE